MHKFPTEPADSRVAVRADRITALLPTIMHSIVLSRTHPEKKSEIVLTFHQYQALLTIRELGPCSLQTLAGRLRLAPSTTSQLIDRLVRADLVTRDIHGRDRRKVVLALNEKGLRVVRSRTADVRKSYVQILSLLNEVEQAAFENAFQTIHDIAMVVESRMHANNGQLTMDNERRRDGTN